MNIKVQPETIDSVQLALVNGGKAPRLNELDMPRFIQQQSQQVRDLNNAQRPVLPAVTEKQLLDVQQRGYDKVRRLID